MATVIQGWRPRPLALAPSQIAGILPRLQVTARLVPQVVVAVVVVVGGLVQTIHVGLAVAAEEAVAVAVLAVLRAKAAGPASGSFYWAMQPSRFRTLPSLVATAATAATGLLVRPVTLVALGALPSPRLVPHRARAELAVGAGKVDLGLVASADLPRQSLVPPPQQSTRGRVTR